MKYSREEWDEKLQEIIKMMEEDYPNDFELVVNSNGGEIRSTLSTMCFCRPGPIELPKEAKDFVENLFDALRQKESPDHACYRERCRLCEHLIKGYIEGVDGPTYFVCDKKKKRIYSKIVFNSDQAPASSAELYPGMFDDYGEPHKEDEE